MNIFPLFQTVLYTISTALLYPVVILLIYFCVWMLLYAGGFLAEWARRREFLTNSLSADSLNTLHQEKRLPDSVGKNLPLHIHQYAEELRDILHKENLFADELTEDLIQRKEGTLLRQVDKIRLIVRIGPSLGLMGTLIPMGTGLAGLTQGNMAQLSSNLILAFATTVVGLALGTSAHVFSAVKERWVTEDIRLIRLITEAMTLDRTDEETK